MPELHSEFVINHKYDVFNNTGLSRSIANYGDPILLNVQIWFNANNDKLMHADKIKDAIHAFRKAMFWAESLPSTNFIKPKTINLLQISETYNALIKLVPSDVLNNSFQAILKQLLAYGIAKKDGQKAEAEKAYNSAMALMQEHAKQYASNANCRDWS